MNKEEGHEIAKKHDDGLSNEIPSDEISSRMKSATASTSRVASVPSKSDGKEEKEEDEDFVIPQRFTRSGRKRAVSFPLKVRKSLVRERVDEVEVACPEIA